jgi:small subunit ribosomal protein S1
MATTETKVDGTPERAAEGASAAEPAPASPPRGERGGRGRGRDRHERSRGGGGRHERFGRGEHGHHRGPRAEFAPPRFNVDELAALSGAPLWQSVHDAAITDVTEAAVFVEVRPLGHAPMRAAVHPADAAGYDVGAAVRVRLQDPPRGQDSMATASIAQALALDSLDKLLAAASDGNSGVPGVAISAVRGGYSVALFADNDETVGGTIRAFLPSSQASLSRFGARSDEIVGVLGMFDIVELEPERANVIVSKKRVLAAERKETLQKRIADINEGDVVKARVKTLVPYGAFLEIGPGIDGMIHQSDLTWDGRARAHDVLHQGQVVDVKVISKNQQTGKIKLGMKQLMSDPWGELRSAFKEGAVVDGVVVALAEFGAFVRLTLPSSGAPVEGLIHVSEVSWQKVKHPSQQLTIGQQVKVKVLGLDHDARRISLSMKALEKNPFEAVVEKFPIGAVVKVKIKSMTDFGAFVELAEGVDGLIHIGELSWTVHPRHPSELLTIAQEVEAVVVNIDMAKLRVGLSIKKTTVNPYDVWEKKYKKGARLKLKVVRVDEKGAWLGVEQGLTCFCFVKDLVGKEGDGRVDRALEAVRMGQEIEVEVKNFDRRFQKVSVSQRAVTEGDTREAYSDYKKQEKAVDTRLNPLAEKLKALNLGKK